ncbi:hypothetical protein DPO80_16575 [Salmonella enterica subsp. salamae]|nr:hypothetical protein [Salmonella enterica subsp. salamae]
MNDIPFVTFTSDPIEGEVSQALALYKIALIKTNYRNFWHRLLCKLRDKESLENERILVKQEIRCRDVINQSDAHREMLKTLISQQPSDIRQRDQFSRLLEHSSSNTLYRGRSDDK